MSQFFTNCYFTIVRESVSESTLHKIKKFSKVITYWSKSQEKNKTLKSEMFEFKFSQIYFSRFLFSFLVDFENC